MGMAAKEYQFHVLAVDDSLLDRKLIERLLKTSSFQVTTVDSGSKALEFLGFEEEEENSLNQPSVSPNSQMEQEKVSLSPRKKDLEVNLVITDYCMPGMTGYDLLKKIKESSYLRNIPVVIMSSENVPSRISRCLEEGAEEFLLKPVRMSDVNKLRPHMLRAKYGGQKEEEKLEQDHDNGDLPKAEQQQKFQQHKQRQTEAQQELQQQPQQQQNNNKRKPLDEGISPDRTRPRYSGLTVV